MYFFVKKLHILCVTLTFISFSVRILWMFQDSRWLQHQLIKTIPHVIDTVLLISGITLAVILHQYPGTNDWLTAKLLALLLYIVLGSIALRRGKTKGIRIVSWLGASLVFFYLVMVALQKTANPLVW